MGDDGLDLVHTDATNGRHRQYFPVNLKVLFMITNHLITLNDHLFDRQTWFSPGFIRFLGKSISYHCSDDCLAHDNFVNSWPFPQRFLVLVFTYPHPNLDIQPIVAVTCPECIGLHASDTPCPALRGHLPYLAFSTISQIILHDNTL